MKTHTVQIVRDNPTTGYLLIYKHVSHCYYTTSSHLLKLYSKLRKLSITIS